MQANCCTGLMSARARGVSTSAGGLVASGPLHWLLLSFQIKIWKCPGFGGNWCWSVPDGRSGHWHQPWLKVSHYRPEITTRRASTFSLVKSQQNYTNSTKVRFEYNWIKCKWIPCPLQVHVMILWKFRIFSIIYRSDTWQSHEDFACYHCVTRHVGQSQVRHRPRVSSYFTQVSSGAVGDGESIKLFLQGTMK